jgi:hypothetical protein
MRFLDFYVDPVTKRPQFAEQVGGTSQMSKTKAFFWANFAVTFRPYVTKGPLFTKIRQFPLTFTCYNGSLMGLSHEISCFFRRSCDKTSTVC